MTDSILPGDVAARVVGARGDEGAAWLRRLPEHRAFAMAAWGLAEDGAPYAEASAALVVPVRGPDGASLVLKLAPATEWLAHEARTLAHWAGRGAVRLQAADLSRGALLLERAVPGTPLAELCAGDDRAATAAAADVIVRLGALPGPARHPLPTLASSVEALGSAGVCDGVPELATACREARSLAAELLADTSGASVLHGDLHHHNLLRAERLPWLAADPKGVIGPREAEPAALLRNPRRLVLSHPHPVALLSDRLDVLAERLGDDVRRLAGWGYALAVLAAFWAAEDRDEDEVRRWLGCAQSLRAVARVRGAL
ncbi:aminoglycoside phosphotransferase family protein [Longimicrobium sp.]|uniref:aminoglycoside phosphotransferase family protein n=1 Tax=Longimicrobium sp. TaxID=2029185 RepID=UPI003B3AF52A